MLIDESGVYSQGNLDRFFKYISNLSSLLSIIIGGLVLIGWYYDIPTLKSGVPYLPTVKIHTAICIILAGISLGFANIQYWKNIYLSLQKVIASIIVIISVLTLIEYILNVNLGVDHFLQTRTIVANPGPTVSRMSFGSALLFLLIGISLLILDIKIKQRWFTQLFLTFAAFVLLPTIMGYLYSIDFMYHSIHHAHLSLPATIAAIFLIIGILFSRPRRGIMLVITSPSAGGYVARRLLFSAITTPLLLGWVLLMGERFGFYDQNYRFLLHVSGSIVVFVTLIWRSARSLYSLDLQRIKVERNIVFLAEASKVLASSLNFANTLKAVGKLAVPSLADWCVIYIFNKNKELEPVSITHQDPQKIKWLQKQRTKIALKPDSRASITQVFKTGQSVLYSNFTDNMIEEEALSPNEKNILTTIKPCSLLVVPIMTQNKPMGVIQILTAESDRTLTQTEQIVTEELAHRAALAIVNSNLFQSIEHALHVRDEFISIASHELKTPLTSIKGYTQLVDQAMRKKPDKKIAGYLQKTLQYIDRLNDLISDLLDVSRIENGKLNFTHTEFELDDLVKEGIESVEHISEHHQIILQNSVKQKIVGDRNRLEQVFTNLLSNAIKYSPESNRVIVNVQKSKHDIIVAITDFGIGIPQSMINKIFDKFYRVENTSRQFPGLGIGLYLSYQIIKRHGGKMWLESVEGQGSTFYFSLPLKPPKLSNV